MSPLALSFFCGVLLALPLVFDVLYPLSFFALVPVFVVWRRNDEEKIPFFRCGTAVGLGYFGLLFNWFLNLYPLDFTGMSRGASAAVVAVGWVGLTALCSVWFGFGAKLYAMIRRKCAPALDPIILAAIWTAVELGQSHNYIFGIPFFRLALSQSRALPNLQSASLFGSLFVSFLIVAVNGYFALAFEKFTSLKKPNIYAFAGAFLIVLNASFGIFRLLASEVRKEDSDYSVAAIQGNVSTDDKWLEMSARDSLELYTSLTEELCVGSDPDLIVWPETAVNVTIKKDDEFYRRLSSLAEDTGASLAIGCFSRDGENRLYNSVMTFLPDGSVCENVYSKRKRVPFGEFMPASALISTLLPFLGDVNVLTDNLAPGTGSEVNDINGVKVGNMVCYDSIYEYIARDAARDGAELITISTNDSWYRTSAALAQHNDHARLRAIETGRYIVRAANTGISSVIDPCGATVSELGADQIGAVTALVDPESEMTLYSVIGDAFAYACLVFLLGMTVWKCAEIIRRRHLPRGNA